MAEKPNIQSDKDSGLFRGEYPVKMSEGEILDSYRGEGAINIHKRRLPEGPIFIIGFDKEDLSFSDVKPLFDYDGYSNIFSSEPNYLIFNLEGIKSIEKRAFDVLSGWYRYNRQNNTGHVAFVNIDSELKKLILSYGLKPDLKRDIQSADGILEEIIMAMEKIMKSRTILH